MIFHIYISWYLRQNISSYIKIPKLMYVLTNTWGYVIFSSHRAVSLGIARNITLLFLFNTSSASKINQNFITFIHQTFLIIFFKIYNKFFTEFQGSNWNSLQTCFLTNCISKLQPNNNKYFWKIILFTNISCNYQKYVINIL